MATTEQRPVLIEAMTYRVGHHSTSDDSSAYRPKREVEEWMNRDNPLTRLRKYMEKKGWWDQEREEAGKKHARQSVLEAFNKAEKAKKPRIENMFGDVYDELPLNLQEQKNEVLERIRKYPAFYPVEDYKKD